MLWKEKGEVQRENFCYLCTDIHRFYLTINHIGICLVQTDLTNKILAGLRISALTFFMCSIYIVTAKYQQVSF